MKKFITSAMLLLPMLSFAQSTGPLGDILTQVDELINFLIPLLLGLAVLVFLWGLVKYVANASDESAKEAGKSLMIWGMIALFVMVSFWGIIGYVQESFGVTGDIISTPAPTVTFSHS